MNDLHDRDQTCSQAVQIDLGEDCGGGLRGVRGGVHQGTDVSMEGPELHLTSSALSEMSPEFPPSFPVHEPPQVASTPMKCLL